MHYERKRGFDRDDGSCLECSNGHAVRRHNKKTGARFMGCSNFPKCANTESTQTMPAGNLFVSRDDQLPAYYEAFYDED